MSIIKKYKLEKENLDYLYINNNSNNLIIVFNYSFFDVTKSRKKCCEGEEVIERDRSKIMHYKYFMELKLDADILFIMDSYRNIVTSNINQNKIQIDYIILNFIESVVKGVYKPQNVYAFGTSKTGYSALYYGMKSDYIINIYSIVPQIKINNYFQNRGIEIENKEYKGVDLELLDKSIYMRRNKNKKIKIYSSKGDINWDEQEKLIDFLEEEVEVEVDKNIIFDSNLNHENTQKIHLEKLKAILKKEMKYKSKNLYIRKGAPKIESLYEVINDYEILKDNNIKYKYNSIYFYIDTYKITLDDLIKKNPFLLSLDINYLSMVEQTNSYNVNFNKIPGENYIVDEMKRLKVHEVLELKDKKIVKNYNTNLSGVDFKLYEKNIIDGFETRGVYGIGIVTNQNLNDAIKTKFFVMYYNEKCERVIVETHHIQSIIKVRHDYPYCRVALKNTSDREAIITNVSLVNIKKEISIKESGIIELQDEEILRENLVKDKDSSFLYYLNNKENLNRTEKLNIRSLKMFNKEESGLNLIQRISLTESIISRMNFDTNDKILDEEIFLKLNNIFYDEEQVEVKKSYIIVNFIYDMITNFLEKTYHYYNHDYIMGLNLISNMEFLNLKEKEVKTFVEKICSFMVVIGVTQEGNGVENTSSYTELIANFIKQNKTIFKVDNILLNKIYTNLEYFKLDKKEYVPIGDYNNINKNRMLFPRTFISLTESGFYIYRENYTLFILKTKLISDAHSHLDMGSFIYYYKKYPIFVELGLYRYSENEEERKFVRSMQAHNLMTCNKNIEVNEYIKNNKKVYHKYFEKPDKIVTVITDNWEKSGSILTEYRWIENVKVNRTYSIYSEDKIQIVNKVESEVKVISHLNLDYRFAMSEIKVMENIILICGEEIDITINVENLLKVEIKNVKQWENMNKYRNTKQLKIYHNLYVKSDNLISVNTNYKKEK